MKCWLELVGTLSYLFCWLDATVGLALGLVGLGDGLDGRGVGLLVGLVTGASGNPLETEDDPKLAVQPRGPQEVDTGCETGLVKIMVVVLGGGAGTKSFFNS